MPKIPKRNNTAPQQEKNQILARMQKRIAIQAGMALTAIALTVIMVFAMTAAWYTNIVHTSGLVFEVESWGFDGVITSNMPAIIAGPGDDGVIDLEVDSDSDSPSAVSVSISKSAMDTEMQQRIYFYADTQAVRNGEVVDRVYLNMLESYTYNLFSQGKLTLTQTVHNAPQLKWHWVYDVLGYYVQGEQVQLSDGMGTKVIRVTDYLRPIEYDYDKATMEYVTDNTGVTTIALKTVDGEQSPEEFLKEFSKTDGYEGTINPDNRVKTEGNRYFYPVDVDEDGTGIYAYLCSYAEIQSNTIWDTALGMGSGTGAAPTYEAKLMVSAQKSKNSVITINSLESLNAAIELGVADTIKLSDSVTISADKVLTVGAGKQVVIDLNNNQLITTSPDAIPIVVEEGGSVTLVNGSIVYQNESGATSKNFAIQVTGGEVVMSKVNLSGYYRGLKIADNSAPNSKDSSVRLVGCDWTTSDTTLLVYGNGRDTAQKSQVVIENSKLRSNSITISGNGSVGNATDGGNYGTDIQIINSEIMSLNGVYSAIYQPQRDSILTIYNSTISGYTGIAVKGGTVDIIGSTVAGWGEGMRTVDAFANSGFNDTGDAVYIETNYNYPIELNISDLVTGEGENVQTTKTVLTSEYQYALRVYRPTSDCVKVNIVSGTFATNGAGIRAVPNEATFSSYIAEGSELNKYETNGNYFVSQKNE